MNEESLMNCFVKKEPLFYIGLYGEQWSSFLQFYISTIFHSSPIEVGKILLPFHEIMKIAASCTAQLHVE